MEILLNRELLGMVALEVIQENAEQKKKREADPCGGSPFPPDADA